jgi:23S rRNA (guanosine2251-2'-O)-methyltransferase
LYYFQASDIKIIAATEKTENSLYTTDFTKGCAIVMGSEGKGITPSVLKIADAKAKLPMFGNIASLNVSVACGVVLYEAVRQRQSSDL